MKKIFFTALIIRLICLYLFRNVSNYDLQSYLQVGELTLKGINIYPDIANLHHPYLPFFLYIEAMAVWLGRSEIIIITIIKIINVIFDLGILYLIYKLSKKNLNKTFLYAVNLVTILIVTLHGQFDVMPIFFLLLAVYWLQKKKELISLLSFSFAILIKTWPVLFLIPIVKRIKNKKLIPLIFLFPILSSFFYSIKFKTPLINIFFTMVGYQGVWGGWGILGILGWLGKLRLFWQKLMTLIFLLSFFGYSFIKSKQNLLKKILNLLFFFFVFTTNFSIQYIAWIIPFLILIKPKNYFQIIFLITFYLFTFYYYWLFCSDCKITPQWLVILQNLSGFLLWFSFIKTWVSIEKKILN